MSPRLSMMSIASAQRSAVRPRWPGFVAGAKRVGLLAPFLVFFSSLVPAQEGWVPTFGGPLGTDDSVRAVTVFDDGSGDALYAGGNFTTAGGVTVNGIAKWDGASWTALGSGIAGTGAGTGVYSLRVFNDGSGDALYAGGVFMTAGGGAANNIAKWNGASWSNLGLINGTSGLVNSMTVFDDGSGDALYVGGAFATAGGLTVNRVARWDGSSWAKLGSGMSNPVRALAVFDDGGGEALFAGGVFTTAGGTPASHMAKWNGASWAALGVGTGGNVNALAVFDDGSGAALYAGGQFTTAGGLPANYMASWDGASWSALGSGMDRLVTTLAVFSSGSGTALYAGGQFTTAGGLPANYMASWSGASWSALGTGVGGNASPSPTSMVVFDDGSGDALHVGGQFTTAGGCDANHIAKWGDGPDTTPPLLVCPAYVFELDLSAPGEFVSFSVQAIDCQDPAPDVVCVPASGSFFPRGITVVTCTATDADGNQSTRQFPVIVMNKHTRPHSL